MEEIDDQGLENKLKKNWKDWIPIYGLYRDGLFKPPLSRKDYRENINYYRGMFIYQAGSLALLAHVLINADK